METNHKELMETQRRKMADSLKNQRARFEAQLSGDAAARIALWAPCKGQVEYVRVLATEAAHYANIALERRDV